jgi:hypothetical protein
MGPSPGADPGLPPYRGRVTAVCDGRAPAQAMAVASASRTKRGLRAYAGARCPRCDSNAHTAVLSGVPLPLGYEDAEPLDGLEPPTCPVREGRSAR